MDFFTAVCYNRFVILMIDFFRVVKKMKTVVFVCTGNTCRSPMAEGMFRNLLRERGISDVEVTSCGTGAFPGVPASDYAVDAAKAYGADISSHRSRPLSRYLVDSGDLFICMTANHRELLLHYLPPDKLRVLADGVSDPYGGTPEQYRSCAAQIWEALQSLVKEF